MPRTNEQIGQFAHAIYEALSKVDLSYEELKSFGECIYAKAPIDRVSKPAIIKLWKAAQALDVKFPMAEPVVAPAPAAAVVTTPVAPAPVPTAKVEEVAAPHPIVTTASVIPEVVTNGASPEGHKHEPAAGQTVPNA